MLATAARPTESMPATLARLRHIARLSAGRVGVEVRATVRAPETVFSLLILPILLLVFLGALFSGEIEGTSLSRQQYFVPSIIAASIFGTTFTNLAMGIALQQHDGMLKRLSGTPLPRSAYFAGKLGAAMVITLGQVALMLAIAVPAFGVDLPSSAALWVRLLWVVALGVGAGCALGIAYTRVIPNARAAPAIVQPPFLVLQFISGVFFVYSELPSALQAVGAVFPLRWTAQGLRSVFLPDEFQAAEVGGNWDVEWVAIVLAIWLVAGLLVAQRTFRWRRDRAG